MNKTQLIHELTERLGDHKTAAVALDEVLAVIVRTVQSGESVTLTGFGVFERRERAARTGRNPRTGEVLAVAATAVPAFRPGAQFRGVVSGARALAEPAALGPRTTSAVRPATRRRPAPTVAVASEVAAKPEKKSRPDGKPDKKSKSKADRAKKNSGKKSGGKKAAKK